MKSTDENLPVVVKQNELTTKVKNTAIKTIKILGASTATLGCAFLTLGAMAVAPVMAIPTSLGMAYSAHKLLNNTLYTGYKDLAFITRKKGNNIKIFQDAFRPDIMKEIQGLTNIEKAGFMQLQAIVGMSKFNTNENKKDIIFETDSHGITQKTFKTLRDLEYIEDYEETYLKDSNLIIPKLAFGNDKIFNNKVQMYNIKFKLSDKQINIADEKLKRAFPIVFGKKGLLATKNYNIIQNSDGSLSIDYKTKGKKYSEDVILKEKKEIQDLLKRGAPTYEEQKQTSIEFIKTTQNEKKIQTQEKFDIEVENE